MFDKTNILVRHWIDTSTGGQLVHEGLNRPVVSASTLTWLIRYI